nr:centromere-associated protein E-like [Pseudochaenichthys georgianus]
MDRRSHQNYPRGNPRPFDHGAEADRAYKQIHRRNGQINGLEEYHGAFQLERTKFFHSMRKQKDKIKRLEKLLKYRDSGLHKEKKLADTIMENIENAECQHKRQMDQMVARHEAEKGNFSGEKDQATSDSVNNDVPLQCDPEIIKLRMRKGEELLEWVTILEDRNSDLEEQMREQEEKFSKDLADKSHTWETEKQQMVTTLNEVTQEKNNMTKETLTLESEFKQVEAKLKQVEKEKDRLAENNLSCETDIKQLKEQVREQEEKFSKDLAEKQLNWEQFVQRKETDFKQLENQLEDQKKKFSKDLALNQESWESKVNLVETKLKEVTQKKDDLVKKHQSMETKLHLMETQLKQVEEQRDDLAQRRLSWATTEKKMKEEKELLEDLCLHMKNKSRGVFSRWRGETEDRDVALQKMISKMQEKEMRKKAKDARNTSSEEMEEASGDSALLLPAGQQ